MRLGEVGNASAAAFGTPLSGIRVLAVEQMQAMPYATQLLGRLGADVVKVEPLGGEAGRGSLPGMADPEGRNVGATFLRNNLNKRSITVDLRQPAGRDLVLQLAPHFDVFAENSRAGAMDALGLGYDAVAAAHPGCIYASISGFGNATPTPYRTRAALAPVVEAMSGIYDTRQGDEREPLVAPTGAIGDIAAGLFATIGILAALRHRETTGQGQYVDVAMLDSMIAMTDIVTNLWSLGVPRGSVGPVIMHGFRAKDGWFVLQIIREHHFAKLAELVGRPEWLADQRFASRQGWVDHLESDIRPAVEDWASCLTKLDAAEQLAANGLAVGPCLSAEEVVGDLHVAARNMLVEMPRTDGVTQPVITPGNPVKLSKVQEGPERRVPWLGEHTDDVLREVLGLGDAEVDALRAAAVI
jgi:crotonobetainyl-CoA:carnitine CoA-transferase CaiB-like acyl-CoA transferase